MNASQSSFALVPVPGIIIPPRADTKTELKLVKSLSIVEQPVTNKVRPRKSLEPWIPDSVHYFDHQIEGIRFLCKRKSFILADQPGLGKTLTALTVFAVDVIQDWYHTCIVVCPATLKANWVDEIQKFTRFPYTVLTGNYNERLMQLVEFFSAPKPKILIVNYEQVTSHLAAFNAFAFDVAIFDEAHYLKNSKAQRTKACMDLYSKRSFMLTGTPMLGHVTDLWTLLHRADPIAWPKFYSYVNRYVVWGGYKSKQVIGVKNERELTEKLHKYQLRRLKKDVLGIPDIQIIEKKIDLLPQQLKLYKQVIEELTIPDPTTATPVEIENALTKFLRLKQICGSTEPFTGIDHSAKMDLACEEDEELLENNCKIVVWTQFRSIQACYLRRMEKLGVPLFQINGDVKDIQRPDVVKKWTATKEAGVLVCTIQTAGIGLNMTASRHSSFLDELFVPGLNQQAIDRQHRIGSSMTQPVQVRKYIARNTIESRIQQILRMKTNLSDLIVESDTGWKKKLLKLMREDAEQQP